VNTESNLLTRLAACQMPLSARSKNLKENSLYPL
jgi:hypothetical protein